jgi:uncharacterized protein (TIGR02452 family)
MAGNSTKEDRIKIAESTMSILDQGFYKNGRGEEIHFQKKQQSAEKDSFLYSPSMEKSIEDRVSNLVLANEPYNTSIEVTEETTLQAIFRLSGVPDVVGLNFASARTPGGGFLEGANAQEESLARSSGLYPCLSQMKEMYDYNRNNKSCLYSDYMIYSPQVPIFKNDLGFLLQKPQFASFITSPAVNAGIVIQREADAIEKIGAVMQTRINKILSVALIQGHNTLVLGAFGCGVFKNNPLDVVKYFKVALDGNFKNVFKKVVFAVYDPSPTKQTFYAFKNSLK